MIVAGVGCRRGTTAEEINAAIDTALAQAGLAPDRLSVIATSDGKGSEQGIIAAAAGRGVKLVLVRPADLEAAGPRTLSSSPRVKALIGVPSVAEAAAMAHVAEPKSMRGTMSLESRPQAASAAAGDGS